MKKILMFVTLVVLFAACGEEKFKIVGTFEGRDSGKVVLRQIIENERVAIDTSEIVDNKFTFTGKVEGGAMMFITTDDKKFIPPFFIDNSTLTITAYNDSLNKSIIKGSEVTESFKIFMDELNTTQKKMQEQYQQARMQPDKEKQREMMDEFNAMRENIIVFAKNYVRNHKKSPVSPLIAKDMLMPEYSVEEMDSLLTTFDKKVHTSQYYKELVKAVADKKEFAANKKALEVGGIAPEFSANTPEGKKIALSHFRGKYLLVDFWASWCNPCRKLNPEMVKLYKKYKSDKFDILGVSVDQDLDKWKEAIKKDNITWPQICEGLGQKSEIAKTYQIRSIPTTLLLDTEGKIIAKNLHGDELVKKLDELLK